MSSQDELNFTFRSEDEFYNIVDSESFFDEDADIIYEYLKNNMNLIPFGEYLKRYIFRKAGFTGDYADVSIKEYQEIIIDTFAENSTPKSFTETSAKFGALTKNWLTQTSVNRNVVFLLGFGLRMSTEEVSDFLVHALNERDFNFKNPFEIICWYCYRHRYKYPKFVQLMDAYNELPYGKTDVASDATVSVRDIFGRVDTEEDLIQKLAEIKTENDGKFFSVTAKAHFDRLYGKIRQIIAEKYSEDAQLKADFEAEKYREKIDNSLRLTIEEKNLRAEKIRQASKKHTAEEINESDVEKFLCCGVPFDGKGNLLKFSNSTLARHFSSKRMNRQHINSILAGNVGVDRFDLITMNFFVFAMDESYEDSKIRFMEFVDDTNAVLDECYFGSLYIANPYECFLQMCILSDWPMGAYADVIEKSFEE